MRRSLGILLLLLGLLAPLGLSTASAAPDDDRRFVLRDAPDAAPPEVDLVAVHGRLARDDELRTLRVRIADLRGSGVLRLQSAQDRVDRYRLRIERSGGRLDVRGARQEVRYEDGYVGPWEPFTCDVEPRWSARDDVVRLELRGCGFYADYLDVRFSRDGARDVLRVS